MKFFVVCLLLCGTAVCQIREYIHIDQYMPWFDAQRYCREHYDDLATITTDEETQRLENAANWVNNEFRWIGLIRAAAGSSNWLWSDGEPAEFFYWKNGQPNEPNDKCCKVALDGWYDYKCETPFTFYCNLKFVLVNDSKTWEEAREYCRTNYTSLASPISLNQLALAEMAIAQTQTVSVWAGLHFVDGQWVSVNSVPLGNRVSLPSCPAQHHRCGALNNKTLLWENRECNEKLNFLCY